jgi:hypothetical protein
LEELKLILSIYLSIYLSVSVHSHYTAIINLRLFQYPIVAFMKRFKRLGSSQKVISSSGKVKRPRKEGGHKNTKMAICLECFEAKKSTVKEHIKTTHKDSISAVRVVQEGCLDSKRCHERVRTPD